MLPLSSQVADRSLLSSLSLVYLCSNLSLIVAKVDGRGTGFRGDKYEPYSSVITSYIQFAFMCNTKSRLLTEDIRDSS